MSKQSEAKAAQGYTTTLSNCAGCANLSSDRVLPEWMIKANQRVAAGQSGPYYPDDAYGIEKNIRCAIGGFAVKKTATCNNFTPKAGA